MKKILADIAEATQAGIGQVRQSLKRMTPREKLLVSGLIMGASLYAPVHALDKLNQSSDAYATALSDQSSARLAVHAARRIQASAVSQSALEDLKTWGIKALNAPVAQVIIEQKLSNAAAKSGLVNPVITTESGVESEGPLHWMRAEVKTDLRWDPALAFIDALGDWPEGFRVVGFRYEIRPMNVSARSRPRDEVEGEQGNIYFSLAFPVILEEAPEQVTARAGASAEIRQ